MNLQEKKKPKWLIKEELNKTQSFDSSLAELGTNGEFLNAKKDEEKSIDNSQLITDKCTSEHNG